MLPHVFSCLLEISVNIQKHLERWKHLDANISEISLKYASFRPYLARCWTFLSISILGEPWAIMDLFPSRFLQYKSRHGNMRAVMHLEMTEQYARIHDTNGNMIVGQQIRLAKGTLAWDSMGEHQTHNETQKRQQEAINYLWNIFCIKLTSLQGIFTLIVHRYKIGKE